MKIAEGYGEPEIVPMESDEVPPPPSYPPPGFMNKLALVDHLFLLPPLPQVLPVQTWQEYLMAKGLE
mgnify:CR=1 FL=1